MSTDDLEAMDADSPYADVNTDPDELPMPVDRRVRRIADPKRWNRSTRWQAGMSMIPTCPPEADRHVRQVFTLLYARVMKDGWEFCKTQPKQAPMFYVRLASWLMAEMVTSHIDRCPGGSCTRDTGWKWLFAKTDTVPPPALPSVEGEKP